MIGVVVTLLLLQGSPGLVETSAIHARFERCLPRNHREALRCLHHVLSPSEKAQLLESSEAGLALREQLREALGQVWSLSHPRETGLSADLDRLGVPAWPDAGRPGFVLQSFALQQRGCRLDLRVRAEDARRRDAVCSAAEDDFGFHACVEFKGRFRERCPG